MLNIATAQSTNIVRITGVLKEMEVKTGVTKTGKDYVSLKATIKADQEVGGKMEENEVVISSFANKIKNDGNPNGIYNTILGYADKFTSLDAAENPSDASRITVSGARLQENVWYDSTNQKLHENNFQISTNFINEARAGEEDGTEFELSGYIGKISPELDKDGNETGRLILKFVVVGWQGSANCLNLIAESDLAVQHIQTNWNEGDTVTLSGIIRSTYKVVTWTEEQGFGEPKKRSRTESSKELIITSGCQCGLDEEKSYDTDDIKGALEQRKARNEELINASKKTASKPASKAAALGF